jgi:HAD superfamily hydrolase (TIGR01509 family)
VAAEGVTPYPGVVELIKSLSGKIPLAICSGALRSDIEPVLRMLSLEDAFDCMVTAEQVAASKPDPASYQLAIRKLQEMFPAAGIIPSLSVAVEDTPAGIDSAKRAGLKVLAVTNSYPAASLAAADRVVASLSGIDAEVLCQLVS